jgi:hypothetical protein
MDAVQDFAQSCRGQDAIGMYVLAVERRLWRWRP